MELPSIQAILGVAPPVFVRKLVRASHWGDPADVLDERIARAVQDVFRVDESGLFSVYLVERDEDLHRVALGLNSNRDSLVETLILVAFLETELAVLGINAQFAEGETKCSGANRCHFDLSAAQSQLLDLCANAIKAGRSVGRFSKSNLKPIVEKAKLDGCRAVVADSMHCICDDE